MACNQREDHGTCGHQQCGFTQHTIHGHQCVDVFFVEDQGFCEVGAGCFGECPYSWQEGSEKWKQAKMLAANMIQGFNTYKEALIAEQEVYGQ